MAQQDAVIRLLLVEVQLEDETPPQWVVDSPYKEFAMYAHITCAS